VSRISDTIGLDVPVSVAYDQWTQFEAFPQFMEGVERVVQLDARTLDWTATIAGRTKHWRAEIVEQVPDRVISWRSTEGARNDGTVRFEPVDAETSRLTVELEVEPDGAIEATGDVLGLVGRRVRGDIERFKAFIESRGEATGAWRGQVEDRPVR
jgi:uncharacterized membrane protein